MGIQLENSFLKAIPAFSLLHDDELTQLSQLLVIEQWKSGTTVISQGETADRLFLLASGRLAVCSELNGRRETLAYLRPPALFGELSMITRRPSTANVQVLADATVYSLPRESFDRFAASSAGALQGLVAHLADRLHQTTYVRSKKLRSPNILLRPGAHWTSPICFAESLGLSLARLTQQRTLIVHIGDSNDAQSSQADSHGSRSTDLVSIETWSVATGSDFGSEFSAKFAAWKSKFPNLIFRADDSIDSSMLNFLAGHIDYQGFLLGKSDDVPDDIGEEAFVLADDERGVLPFLNASRQILRQSRLAEADYLSGSEPPAMFVKTVDSIARWITGRQLGIALGGGAAWGLTHVGGLIALEQAGLPIDLVSGCSMGSIIGALFAAGHSPQQIKEIVIEETRRPRRLFEVRLWKLNLLNRNVTRQILAKYMDGYEVNGTHVPFWTNTLDIETGDDLDLKDGSLIDAVLASTALPGLFGPFSYGNRKLVDAFITDPVPINQIRRMGAHFAIAVNVLQIKRGQSIKRWPLTFPDLMSRYLRIGGYRVGEERSELAADYIVRPDTGKISMLDFGRSKELIEIGEREFANQIPSILAAYSRLA